MKPIILFFVCIFLFLALYSITRIFSIYLNSKSIRIAFTEFVNNLKQIKEEILYSKLDEPNDYLKAQLELRNNNLTNAKRYLEDYIHKSGIDKRAIMSLVEIYILRGEINKAIFLLTESKQENNEISFINNFGQLDKLLMVCYKLIDENDKALEFKESYLGKNKNEVSRKIIDSLYKNPKLIKHEITSTNLILD